MTPELLGEVLGHGDEAILAILASLDLGCLVANAAPHMDDACLPVDILTFQSGSFSPPESPKSAAPDKGEPPWESGGSRTEELRAFLLAEVGHAAVACTLRGVPAHVVLQVGCGVRASEALLADQVSVEAPEWS